MSRGSRDLEYGEAHGDDVLKKRALRSPLFSPAHRNFAAYGAGGRGERREGEMARQTYEERSSRCVSRAREGHTVTSHFAMTLNNG